MSGESSKIIKTADIVSELLYSIAGVLSIGLGIFGLVIATLRVIKESVPADPTPSALVLVFSLLLLILGVFVIPQFRRRVNRRQSPTQFGRTQNVDTRVLRPEEETTDECVVCGSQSDRGLIKRYRQEFCFVGIPVLTTAEGHNFYCIECAATDSVNDKEIDSKNTEIERN